MTLNKKNNKIKKYLIIHKRFKYSNKKIFYYKSIKIKYKNNNYLKEKLEYIRKKRKTNIYKSKKRILFFKSKPNNKVNIASKKELSKKIIKHIVKFCVFVGREKNLKILHSYIDIGLRQNILDEYHMFDFSRNINDNHFIMFEYNRLINIYPERIFLHNYNKNENNMKQNNIKTDWSPFYKYISSTFNESDVIIKCDDDILFIDIFSLKNAINDRIKDKRSFLIHSNCINNGVCSYYQSDLFPKIKDKINVYPNGGLLGPLFEKPEYAHAMHSQFAYDLIADLNNLNKYIIDDKYINSRISINFVLINGTDLKYLKDIGIHDEYELSSFIPEKLLRLNKIKGDLITSHLSYSVQEKILLNREDIYNNYRNLLNKYLNLQNGVINNFNKVNKLLENQKAHKNIMNNTYIVKNWIKDNHYYIKNIETNKYLCIDYDDDQIYITNDTAKKQLFEINFSSKNNNVFEIKLGLYNLSKYNAYGKFRNEAILYKNMKDESEKILMKDDLKEEQGSFYIKFIKYNNYLSISSRLIDNIDTTIKCENRWIFEKAEKKAEFITVTRFIKNNKYYYKNIDTEEIYTNFYMGWGWEGVMW